MTTTKSQLKALTAAVAARRQWARCEDAFNSGSIGGFVAYMPSIHLNPPEVSR